MSDDLSKRGPQDRSRINLLEPHEVQYWADKFNVSKGRRTYEIFAAHWPYAGKNPITDGFNRATKYVATRGKPEFDWVNSQALQGDAVEAVRQLKSGTGPEIQIYGSSSFLQALIAANLIDEYLIRTYPLVLGRGKRLFEEGTPPRALRLVETEQSSTGVITSRYLPDGPVQPGSFGGHASKAEVARRRRGRHRDVGQLKTAKMLLRPVPICCTALCPLLAQSGHTETPALCPLLGAKRTRPQRRRDADAPRSITVHSANRRCGPFDTMGGRRGPQLHLT